MAFTFQHSLVIAFLVKVFYTSEDLHKVLIDCEQFFLNHMKTLLQFLNHMKTLLQFSGLVNGAYTTMLLTHIALSLVIILCKSSHPYS